MYIITNEKGEDGVKSVLVALLKTTYQQKSEQVKCKLTSKNKKSYPKVAQFVNIITSILQEGQAYQARSEALQGLCFRR